MDFERGQAAVRDASLVAGANLAFFLRARAPRPLLIAAALLAAGLLIALAHVADADIRGALGGGQSGLLPGFLQALSEEQSAKRP